MVRRDFTFLDDLFDPPIVSPRTDPNSKFLDTTPETVLAELILNDPKAWEVPGEGKVDSQPLFNGSEERTWSDEEIPLSDKVNIASASPYGSSPPHKPGLSGFLDRCDIKLKPTAKKRPGIPHFCDYLRPLPMLPLPDNLIVNPSSVPQKDHTSQFRSDKIRIRRLPQLPTTCVASNPKSDIIGSSSPIQAPQQSRTSASHHPITSNDSSSGVRPLAIVPRHTDSPTSSSSTIQYTVYPEITNSSHCPAGPRRRGWSTSTPIEIKPLQYTTCQQWTTCRIRDQGEWIPSQWLHQIWQSINFRSFPISSGWSNHIYLKTRWKWSHSAIQCKDVCWNKCMNSMDFYTIVPGGHYRNDIIIRKFDLLASIVTTEPTLCQFLFWTSNGLMFSSCTIVLFYSSSFMTSLSFSGVMAGF